MDWKGNIGNRGIVDGKEEREPSWEMNRELLLNRGRMKHANTRQKLEDAGKGLRPNLT